MKFLVHKINTTQQEHLSYLNPSNEDILNLNQIGEPVIIIE